MASAEHWAARRNQLLDPDWGARSFVPMEPDALVANGPSLAISDALELMVLGLGAEAATLLEFVPRLRDALADPATLAQFAEHRQCEAAAYLRESLMVGAWLASNEIDRQLADDAYAHLVKLTKWWGGTPTGPNVMHLMLLSLEAGQPDRALRDYEQYEKKRDRVLTPVRLAKNPRALLVVHIDRPAGLTLRQVADALEQFRRSAIRWERGIQPVPYVGIVTLARVLRACAELRREPTGLLALLPQIA